MNVKTKSILVISGTLIIGMILGSLITAAYLKNRAFDRIADWRSERGFVQRIERIIQPDEAQQEPVRQILMRHFSKMDQLGEQMRGNFEAMNDSLIKELETVLTPEQISRFKKKMERMKRPGRHRRPHGKPMREERPAPPENQP